MIGVLQQAASSGVAPPSTDLEAFITPSQIVRESSNGSYTTSVFTLNVTGGEAPYTYLWEVTSGSGSLVQTNEDSTRVALSGYNSIGFCVIRCTVTDNLADTVSGEASITVQFGSNDL